MANIKQAFEYAAQNPESEFARNLEQLASSGALDTEAKKYGIDLSPFKPKETLFDKAKDYATQAVTNPVETAKGAVKGAVGGAAQLTKLVETPGKFITGKIAEAVGAEAPQGLDFAPVEEMTQASNKAQEVGKVVGTLLPVERAIGGAQLLKSSFLKGTEAVSPNVKTAYEAVKLTPSSLKNKAVDFISNDPDKKVETILKRSTPQELDNYLDIAEKSSVSGEAKSVFEVVGDKLFDVTKVLDSKLKEIGSAKSAIVEPSQQGLNSFKKETKPLIEKLTSLKNSFTEIDKGNKSTVQAIINDAKTVSTVRDADIFVDKLQNALYTGNIDMTIPRGSSLDKQLRGIIGEYNSSLKKALPKEYAELNQKYSTLIDSLDTINRSLGEVVEGVPVRGASLIKQYFSPSGSKTKEIFEFIKKETNGEVDLAKEATLAKFAGQLFDDPNVGSLLGGIKDVPTSAMQIVGKVIEKVGGEKLTEEMRKSTVRKAKKVTK